VEYYSAINKNVTQMSLEDIIIKEISQSQKNKYHMTSFKHRIKRSGSHIESKGVKSRRVVTRGWRRRKVG
jgi:hypothetical protein